MNTTYNKHERVIVWGDSLAKGVVWNAARGRYGKAAKNAAELVARALDIEVENRARFGITSVEGLQLIENDLEKGVEADAALIEFGGNDCNFDWAAIAEAPEKEHLPVTTPEVFERTMRQIAEKLKRACIRPVFMTLPPIDAEKYFRFLTQGINAENVLKWLGDKQRIYRFQEMYSLIIEKVARETGAKLLDLRRRCLEDRGMFHMLCEDGLHLSDAGQAFVARELARLVQYKD